MSKAKCVECSKKVGLYGIKCRCVDANNNAMLFCSSCIGCKLTNNDKNGHHCSFDYKQMGKTEFDKKNPLIIPMKVDKL